MSDKFSFQRNVALFKLNEYLIQRAGKTGIKRIERQEFIEKCWERRQKIKELDGENVCEQAIKRTKNGKEKVSTWQKISKQKFKIQREEAVELSSKGETIDSEL